MTKVLIVYGTSYGQTERIAQEIARILRSFRHAVDVVKGDRMPGHVALEEYDGFVIAASVLYGRHQRYIRAFVRDHVDRLNAAPSAFASVCGAMGGTDPESARQARSYLDEFLRTTGWRPGLATSFAGAVSYSRYAPWVRWMMKLISHRTGRPTDTSRDYDFTDWRAVETFAHVFAGQLAATLQRSERGSRTRPKVLRPAGAGEGLADQGVGRS